jgi:hypothetical protein
MSAHPAPHASKVKLHKSFFALFGGPIAWLAQLCGGYALATQPCFTDGTRVAEPLPNAQWTWPAMVALMVLAVAVSLIALAVSWRALRRTRNETHGDEQHLMETGSGRTRFLALWGVVLGGGCALATALTAVGFIILQRCAG